MSSQRQPQGRPRSMSAKAPSSKSRPLSGLTTTTIKLPSKNMKTELITSIYNGKQKSPKKSSSKNLLYQGINTEEFTRFKRNSNADITKQKQLLYEQNIQLKKQINKLTQQLSIIKSKVQTKSRKTIIHQKQLDIQFEKEMHWGGTKSYMITGIKHQYEKLKKQHSDLVRSYGQLKIVLMQTKIPEYKIYAQAIQIQNKRLIEHIKKLQKFREQSFQNLHSEKQVSLAISAQNQQNCRILTQKLTKIDIQLRNANQSLKDKQKKIQFQQKLLIQKGNNQFHLDRKLKKSQQINLQLQHKITLLLQQIKQSHKQIQAIETNAQIKKKQQLRQLQSKYQSQNNQLYNKIQSLQEQNKLLQMTVNKLRMSSSIVHNNSSNIGLVSNRSYAGNNRKNIKTPVQEMQQQQNKKNNNSNKLGNFESVQSKNIIQQAQRQRIPRRADRKHSQNSKKMRRVQIQQVKQIGQIIKYRMIYKKISPTSIKQYFNYNPSQHHQNLPSKQPQQTKQIQWHNKYLTMQQTYKILSQQPFNLNHQSSLLLARYLIEDCYQQYIFCDPLNQNTRDIVKSIIKSVIGQYNIPRQAVVKEGDDYLGKYWGNLQSALKMSNPMGKINKKKLMDTINGLGVNIGQQAVEYLLSIACKNCHKLDQIYYDQLFIK